MFKTDFIIQDLYASLDKNNFIIQYQPQFTENHQITGIEALARWKDSKGNFISPDVFIPLLEENQLIYPFGLQVANKSFECAYTMLNHLKINYNKMAINVSPLQLDDQNFVDDLEYLRKHIGLETQGLTIEITESSKITSDHFDMIKEFNNLGYGISIDDFGTGYSSFQYIMNVPLTNLKLDRSFIQDIHLNKSQQSIVYAIINMCTQLKIPVIAEGVESIEEIQFLSKIGCKHFQGYYFSKPLNDNDLFEIAA